MKIKKLQSGGLPPLFTTFTPVTVTNPYAGVDPMLTWLQQMGTSMVGGASASGGSSSSSSSSSSSGMPTMKDTMALLKDMKGLDSDMNTALASLQQSAQEASVFGTTDSLVSSYYRNINLVNKVNQSKEAYDAAYKMSRENGSIREAAVTSDGKVIVREKGSKTIRAIDPSEYFKNRGNYQIQTNSNLLYERAHDKSMAFNDSVLEIVQNGTSMEEITKYVNDIAGKLGTSSESLQGYTAKQAEKIAGGIQALQDATKENIESLPMDGIYKITLKSESQNEQASYAISAIYNSLTEGQKALLKLHSNGKDSGAIELIKQMVMKNVDVTKEFTPEYQKDLSKDLMGVGGSSESDDAEKSKSGVAGNWFLGYGNRSEYTIQDESNMGIHVTGNDLPITEGGKSIGIATLDKVASSDYGGVLDFDNATMGNGMKLDPLGLSKVAVNGTTIVGVELPIDPNNPNQPYFALLKNKSEADSELRNDHNITNPDSEKLTLEQKNKINEVYKKHGLPAKYDEKGNTVPQAYRRFGMITGTTTTDAFVEGVGDLDISGMKDVTSRNERENYETVRRESSSDKKYSIGNGWGPWDWFADDLYKGTIFVPVKNNYFNAISSSGSSTYPTVGRALGIEAAQQQTDAMLNTLNTQKLQ